VLTGLLLILPKLGMMADNSGIYRILNCYLYPINNLLLPPVSAAELDWWRVLVAPFVHVLTVAAPAGIGYFFGFNRFSLYQAVVFQNK